MARSRGRGVEKGPRRRGRRRKKSRGPWGWVLATAFALVAAALVAVSTRHAEPLRTGLMSGPAPTVSQIAPQAQAASQAQQPSGDMQANAESEKRADGPSRDTDQKAAEYFRTHWNDKAAGRLKEIRTVGGYLRLYTDLPESAHNSAEAVTLCERGLEYLRQEGVEEPIVFVQAEYGDNGNPVLANVIGPSDTNCRLTDPEPR
ncbi:hypothetical protein ACIBHX_03580 [Nonomuraea sp. NPDC050536]|uniref:hypothetical protein n=1 Tax=Nonomuraea sp. NPDC050536 TaxID=3364366 RepID=UPI0037C74CFA